MEKCNHEVKRENETTGDPFQVQLVCVKCGEKAVHNLITNETR